MKQIDENILNQMKKDLEKFETNKGRLALKKEVRYLKYRESLIPISKDEFLSRLNQINERFEKYLESCEKYQMSSLDNDKDFYQVLSSVKKAKNGLDYAEIIDKLENIINDLEAIVNNWQTMFGTVQQIKNMMF